MTFGATLRTERQRLRLTLAQVAKKAGMSTQRLAEVETSDNDARTSPTNIVRLAKVLRLDALDMLKLARPDDYRAWKRAFAQKRSVGKGCCQVGACGTHAPKRTGAKGAE